MKPHTRQRHGKSEAGVALLIAIFVLLIIGVIGMSLVLGSRTETSLAGNFRYSTAAYYSGFAGLEEARGRLITKNVDYFNNTVPGFIPTTSPVPLPIGQVRYIRNPAPGEVVAPTAVSSPATYPDLEYATEFSVPITSATVQTIPSVSGAANIPGPPFKWVRISAATEKSVGIDVDNSGGSLNSTTPLFYDAGHVDSSGAVRPSLIVTSTPPSTAKQAFEVTALAVMPNGGQKLLQYVIAPVSYNLTFPSALTLAGQGIAFSGANSASYSVNGQDGSGNPPAVAGCTPNTGSLPALSVTDASGSNTNLNAVVSGIPVNRLSNYTGGGLSTPSVSNTTTLNPALESPSSLDKLVQTISQNADLVINGNATQANMPSTMSASNPETIVVNGDFSMTSNFTGYGLLVVTGNFAYSGTTGWKGIVLVIGDGTTSFLGAGGGNNEFDGAIFVATTKDALGNELSTLGNVGFNISGGGGNGVYYNSCWINNAQQPPTYQVLSFREIAYNTN